MTREESLKEEGRITFNEYVKELGDYTFGEESMVRMFVLGAIYADQNPREGLWVAEKVCKWISERIGIDQKIETNSDGEPLADSYIAYCIARKNAADTIIKDLRKAMEE